MSNSLNISDVITHVKCIVDSVRCAVCDKASGDRIRFPCGHTTCDDCLIGTEGCMLCLTPPTALGKPERDNLLTQRVQNASNLLNVCQDTFNLDVYRRLRMSEQLKAEKVLFPECIQAPAKYSNKRKSNNYTENKENLYKSFHLGECTTSYADSFKMKKCDNYVQQWLENSQTYNRKALGDLNVNKQHTAQNDILPQKTVKPMQKQNNKKSSNKDACYTMRKRLHSSTSFSVIDRENSFTDFNIKKSKKSKFDENFTGHKKVLEYMAYEESGIVLDDEPILIEDSQTQYFDKDRLALLAVQEAERVHNDSKTSAQDCSQDTKSVPLVCDLLKPLNQKNVIFYKKGSLADCCFYCNVDHKPNVESCNDRKNVSINIENQHFITTINVSKSCEFNLATQSVSVQTNISDVEKVPYNKDERTIEKKNKEIDERKNKSTDSVDILQFQDNKLHDKDINISKKGCIVIEDSGSEDSFLEGSFLQVTAEVHRSCDQVDYGILSEISTSEIPSRSRNKVRATTPDSNNSSDKENCDPNKRKKLKSGKKYKHSKK